MERLSPIHPGEILREEFAEPLGLDAAALTVRVATDAREIEALLSETAPITARLAHRLARIFGTTPAFWMNLQSRYDLARAEDEGEPSAEVVPLSA